MKAVSDRFEALLYSCLYLDGASSKTALISASERLWRLAIRSTLTPSERSTQICRFSLLVIIIVPPICRHDCRTQHPHDAADNQADDKCNYRTQSFSSSALRSRSIWERTSTRILLANSSSSMLLSLFIIQTAVLPACLPADP